MSATTRKRILTWAQNAMFVFAFGALGYCGYVMTASWIFQRQETRSLERLIVARQTTIVDESTESPEKKVQVQPGGLIGRIDVPRLGISVVVMEGTDARTLKRAAGHIIGTVLPGQTGNVGIAAHRDTFFRPLRDIRKDDIITVTTPNGDFRYRVISASVVNPDDLSVLNSDGTDVLTLVTCYPFSFVGSAPNRFIVRAQQVS